MNQRTARCLNELNRNIGDWASIHPDDPRLNYCGWMGLHIDAPFNDYNNSGIWRIRVVEVDPEAVLVHRKNGVFVIDELAPGKIIPFRYDRWHGLLPRDIAKHLEGRRRWKGCKEYVEWLNEHLPNHEDVDNEQDRARIIWEFV